MVDFIGNRVDLLPARRIASVLNSPCRLQAVIGSLWYASRPACDPSLLTAPFQTSIDRARARHPLLRKIMRDVHIADGVITAHSDGGRSDHEYSWILHQDKALRITYGQVNMIDYLSGWKDIVLLVM